MLLPALALLAHAAAARGGTPAAVANAGPVWVRLDLIENTAEGSGFDRCSNEATLKTGQATRWRLFYGEARPDSISGWVPIRSASGCEEAGSEPATWTRRGSPYFLLDVALRTTVVSGRDVFIEATLSSRTLTGFSPGGAPAYGPRTEKRTLRVTEGSSAVVPILIANERETDAFRVRELLLKIRARGPGGRSRVEYGEIGVSADVARAEIFLDGGFAGRTSSDGAVLLRAVRVGERTVIVQDASGREARAVARVQKGRKTILSLTLMKGKGTSADGLRPLGRNPQGGDEFWREKDGAIVVRIPGGEFQMGSEEGEGESYERPRHAVRVRGFLIDKTEVTWGQYKRFLAASSRHPVKVPVWGMPEALPASSVTWGESQAFCTWVGGRLPTEAEWERAARGDDSRQYPWGNTFDPWRCNTRDGGPHAPTPAGAYPDCVSPYGVLDLAGSMWEWASDWYEETYDAKGPVENPTGPETGTRRAVRGGNWMSAASWVRGASRLGIDPTWPGPMLGFRCVQDDRKADK